MNKVLRFVVSLLTICSVAISSSAATYTHSIGGMIGGMNGASYKGFILGVDGLALQADLAIGLTQAAGSAHAEGVSARFSQGLFTFEANPNVVYQQTIREFSWGDIDWFAGGGASLGMGRLLSGMADGVDATMGKFGINAMGGIEFGFSQAPLSAGIDFRPGYGLAFHRGLALNYFDWNLVASLRYCF